MNKKGGIRTGFIMLLMAFFVVLGSASFLASWENHGKYSTEIQGEVIRVGGNNAIMLPGSEQDIPDGDEGTIQIVTKPPIEVFDQFGDTRKYIVFFTSTTLRGMRVVYDLEDRRFEAGMPLMKSETIDIFDNQPHQVIYTFKKGVGQTLYVDGNQVDSSDFKEPSATAITGFIVGTDGVLDEVDVSGIEVSSYDHYVSKEELKILN